MSATEPTLRAPLFPVLALLGALALSACETPGPSGSVSPPSGAEQGRDLARLEIIGPNVTVNGRPASNGMTVKNGQFIATGPGSRARLRFFSGGILQMEQNTDPSFWERLLSSGKCLIEFILDSGTVSGQSGDCDVEAATPTGDSIFIESQYVLTTSAGASVLTILEGKATIRNRGGVVVRAGEQLVMTRDAITGPRRLSDREIRTLINWLNSYDFSRGTMADPPVQTPTLFGLTPDEAQTRLTRVGLGLQQVGRRASQEARPGTIIAQQPPAGAVIPPGTDIHVTIAEAGAAPPPTPTPNEVTVPGLYGRTLEEAMQELRAAKLKAGRQTRRPMDDFPSGRVVDQSPKRDSRVPPGSAVNLVISAPYVRTPTAPVVPVPITPVTPPSPDSQFEGGQGLQRGEDTSGLDVMSRNELGTCVRIDQAHIKLVDESEIMAEKAEALDNRIVAFDKQLDELQANLNRSDAAAVDAYNDKVNERNALNDRYKTEYAPAFDEMRKRESDLESQWRQRCANRYYYQDDMMAVRRELGLR